MVRKPIARPKTSGAARGTLGSSFGECESYEENFFLRNLLKQQSAERERLRDLVDKTPFTSRREKHFSLDFARSRSCTDLNKARKAGDRRPSYSQKEPQIRRIQKDFNQMSVSLDTGKRSDLLNRRQQNRPDRLTSRPRNVSAELENRRNVSRRSSEATRNRSLVRQAQANDRLHSSNYSKNKITENRRSHRQDKKSVKSTEGSSKKSTKESETAQDETEDCGMDETDELYRRITSWVDTVNKHIEADDFDKCVIMENIDYSDDIERPSSSKSPGNHHHVEIVLYNGD